MSKETQQKTEIPKKFNTYYERKKTGQETVYKGKNVKHSSFHFAKPSMTEQQFKHETDINNIVKGAISNLPPRNSMPVFADFPDPNAYVESMNMIADAHSLFETMPSDIREKFKNSPEEMLRFMADENNKDEAIKLGLVKGPEVITVENGYKYVNGQYVGFASLDEIEEYQKKDVTPQGGAEQ